MTFYLRIYRNGIKIPIFSVFYFKETAGRLDNLKQFVTIKLIDKITPPYDEEPTPETKTGVNLLLLEHAPQGWVPIMPLNW